MHRLIVTAVEAPAISNTKSRLMSLDTQRGLIMILMALSHCLEYITAEVYTNDYWHESPWWQGHGIFGILHQSFMSFLSSGGFFMMMGISIALLFNARLEEKWSLSKINKYLITRGSLLIFLQFTVLQVFEWISEGEIFLYFGVLASLGICMIAASLLLYCGYVLAYNNRTIIHFFLLFVSLFIPLLCSLVMHDIRSHGDSLNLWQIIFFVGGEYRVNGFNVDINFTPLPWFSPVALGLFLGLLIIDYKERAFNIILKIALAFLLSWFVLRLGNIYTLFDFGDYKIFDTKNNLNFANLWSMTKYPPSITFFLWSLGVNMLLLAFWHRFEYALSFVSKPLNVLGRCALFFFIAHWFVYYGLSGFFPGKIDLVSFQLTIWAFGIVVLYYMCKYFYAFKMSTPRNSLWRMF